METDGRRMCELLVGLGEVDLMLLWLSNRVLVGCEGGEPLVVSGGELMVVVDASFEL